MLSLVSSYTLYLYVFILIYQYILFFLEHIIFNKYPETICRSELYIYIYDNKCYQYLFISFIIKKLLWLQLYNFEFTEWYMAYWLDYVQI